MHKWSLPRRMTSQRWIRSLVALSVLCSVIVTLSRPAGVAHADLGKDGTSTTNWCTSDDQVASRVDFMVGSAAAKLELVVSPGCTAAFAKVTVAANTTWTGATINGSMCTPGMSCRNVSYGRDPAAVTYRLRSGASCGGIVNSANQCWVDVSLLLGWRVEYGYNNYIECGTIWATVNVLTTAHVDNCQYNPPPPPTTLTIQNTGGIGVRLRNSPYFNDIKSNGPPEGASVVADCYTTGDVVEGSSYWVFIEWNGTNGYIPAVYSNFADVPRWPPVCSNVPGPPAPVTSIANGNFESGTSPWKITYQPAGVTVNRSVYSDPSRAHSGNGWMEANTNWAGGSVGQDSAIVPQAGKYYWLRVWVRDPTGSSQPFSISPTLWALGGTEENAQTSALVGWNWTPIDVVFAVHNGGHSNLRVEFYMNTINRNVDFDDASVTVSDTPPNINTTNPIGSFDAVSAGPGTISVRGWSFDPNDPTTPNHVHVYIGGQAGSGAPGYDIGAASAARADVGAAYPYAGPNHGFDTTLSTSAVGPTPVCAYGINLLAGNNVLLPGSCKTIDVPPPHPAHDNIADPCTLTFGSPLDISNVGATHEANEPQHASVTTSTSVWCRFTVPKQGTYRIITAGSGWDTVLALYSGSNFGNLQLIAGNDDSDGTTQSRIEPSLLPGVTYLLAIDGFNGATGIGHVSSSLLSSYDDYATPCSIVGNPGTVQFPTTGFTWQSTHDADGAALAAGATASAWCRYVAPITGTATFTTAGSNFDTFMSVMEVNGAGGGLPYNDDVSATDLTSRLTLHVSAGDAVLLEVAGTDASTGNLVLTASVASDPPPTSSSSTTSTTSTTTAPSNTPPTVPPTDEATTSTSVASGGPAPKPDTFVGITPNRLLDTRPGYPTVDGQQGALGRRLAGSMTTVQVGGRGGVPGDAAAVVLNVAAISPDGAGFLTVWPCGEARPLAASANFSANDVVSNAVVSKIGVGGTVCIYTYAATDVAVDVTGYFPAASQYVAKSPARLLDTRNEQTSDGQQRNLGRRSAGSITEVQVTGRAGVPTDAVAVVLNVAAVDPAAGYLTVFPCGNAVPLAANLNFGQRTTSNTVVAGIGTNGRVCVYSYTATDLVVDVDGWFPHGSNYTGLVPARLYDGRYNGITVDGQGSGAGYTFSERSAPVAITGRGGVPADASSVVLNIAATNTLGPGYVTVYPCGGSVPVAANLNWSNTGQTTSNAAVVQVGAGGSVCLFTHGLANLVVDVDGYLSSS